MSSSLTLKIPKALPSLLPSQCRCPTILHVNSEYKIPQNPEKRKVFPSIIKKQLENFQVRKSNLAIQVGVLLAIVEQPALAVTGVNNEPDIIVVLIQSGIIAFWYFLIMPPIIMNWLRLRWYERKFLEMYLQFMCVFIFFPGLLLWAPFVNVRKFPRDPNMEYPWSVPDDPSKIKNDYLKYPFAKPEDYEIF